MAHVSKFTKSASGHLTQHYERAKDENGNYIKFGNQDIDTSKTHLNYNLDSKKEISQIEFLQKRCSEVQCLNRKDVKVMCTWIITAPKNIKSEAEEKKFFEESYQFLSQKYGKENIISSYVHKDESQPHMHFSFVPVVMDQKKGHLKISAKECLSKNHLQKFHSELDNHMQNVFGYDIGILNEATKEGNKEIQALKQATLLSKAKDLEKDIELLRNDKSVLQEQIEGYTTTRELQKTELKRVEKIIDIMDDTSRNLLILDSWNLGTSFNEKTVEHKEVGVFKKEQIVSMPEKEWDNFKEAYHSLENYDKIYDQFKRQIIAIFDEFKTDDVTTLEKKVKELEEKNHNLERINRNQKIEIKDLKEEDKKTVKLVNKILDKVSKETNTNFKQLFIEASAKINKQQSQEQSQTYELER